MDKLLLREKCNVIKSDFIDVDIARFFVKRNQGERLEKKKNSSLSRKQIKNSSHLRSFKKNKTLKMK